MSHVTCHVSHCHLTPATCSFSCYESPRRFSDAAARGLMINREKDPPPYQSVFKSCIRETLNVSTGLDSSTNIKEIPIHPFFFRGEAGSNKKQGPKGHKPWPIRKVMRSHEKVMRKSWEIHKKSMRKSRQSHEKIMRKSWEKNEKIIWNSWESHNKVKSNLWKNHEKVIRKS